MAETKDNKAIPKKQETATIGEAKVKVKAAVIPQKSQEEKKASAKSESETQEKVANRVPLGKLVDYNESETRASRAPMGGIIVPKKDSKPKKKEESIGLVPSQNEENIEKKKETGLEKKPAVKAANKPEETKKVEAKETPMKTKEQEPSKGEKVSKPKETSKTTVEKKEKTVAKESPSVKKPEMQKKREERTSANSKSASIGNKRSGSNKRDGQSKSNNRSGQGKSDNRSGGYHKDKSHSGYKGKEGTEHRQNRNNKSKTSTSSGEILTPLETKYTKKDPTKRNHAEKERNKFAKLEDGAKKGGKKNKEKIKVRSLEKAAKPKKHSKYKAPAVEIEEEAEELLPVGTVAITVPITVGGFCEQANISINQVIMALMKMGIMANINQNLDEDTVELLAVDLGLSIVIDKVEGDEEEFGIENFEDKEEDLKHRAPFVTVMGHVDHGKTSLLDAIRATNVVTGEAGGITQHIGASEVTINGQKIVFLDTPGHEAFTAMRARGAHVTDIAVLVVAADDGVMPQTIESISHARAAGVPIIVAINKMDKPSANPDRVKQELTEHGILVEDWGGDTISVPVSAKSREGITSLLEMILLQAEVLELKANPNRRAMGSVIEARLDKNKGPVATLLVTNGTLRSGDPVVVGNCYGRIRLMTDFKGDAIKKAGPATAVEILGLDDVPEAGDEFNAVKGDKLAREIAENRKQKLREEILARNASSTLEELFNNIKEGEMKDLNLIIKGDVAGSIGAIVASLEKLNNENVRVKIVHTGVGTVTESDVMLASTTGAVIIGFNVRPSTAVQSYAEREQVQIRNYRIIYDIINDIEAAMKGMLDPEFKEEILGKVEVRSTFKVPNVGVIAGAYVLEGKVIRNAEIRLVRDGIVIHEGKISSLKRYKDDAKEVNQGYECGIGIENYNDIKDGDLIECFHMVEIERK